MSSTNREYGIVFPLRKGGYYCIDSVGKATGREVKGLFEVNSPKNCGNATRVVPVGPSNNPPVITLVPGDYYEVGIPGPGFCGSDGCVVMYDHDDPNLDPYVLAKKLGLETEFDPQIIAYQIGTVFTNPYIPDALYAFDVEEGDVSGSLDFDSLDGVFNNDSRISTAAAQQALVQSGAPYTITGGCDSNYGLEKIYASDSDGNSTTKEMKIYSCIYE